MSRKSKPARSDAEGTESKRVERRAGLPTRDQIVRAIHTKQANEEWLERHRDEIRRKSGDKYVAVLDGRVVVEDRSFPRMLARLKKAYPSVDPSLAAIEFVSKDEVVWVL